MGKLMYDSEERPIHIDDRALAHLKVVIATKLRRQESFILSWQHAADDPGGRSTIWLHPSIPLQFVFDDVEPPQLNARWIEELMQSTNATGEIVLLEEIIEGDTVPSDTVPSDTVPSDTVPSDTESDEAETASASR